MSNNKSEMFGKKMKIFLHVIGFLFGFLIGGFVVFQILFLMKVIPHGGF